MTTTGRKRLLVDPAIIRQRYVSLTEKNISLLDEELFSGR